MMCLLCGTLYSISGDDWYREYCWGGNRGTSWWTGCGFWMWIVALLGMATKYAECLLAVKYRVRDKQGFMAGGPMYYIERGLGIKWLAKLFALFGILVAFFGIGTFPQINAITHAMQDTFSVPIPLTASIITALVALIILGA